MNQLVTSRLLRRHGHEVTVVGDGEAAVRAVSDRRFDAVLMDIRMPLMDGLQATTAIRAMEAQRGLHTPVIALTAHAMSSDHEALLSAGMDAYVAKPVSVKHLFAVLRALATKGPVPPIPPPGPRP